MSYEPWYNETHGGPPCQHQERPAARERRGEAPTQRGNSPTSGVTAVPTNEQDASQVKASDLLIALYLNQRVTFDLLAILEDGFAQMTTLQASSSSSEGSAVEAGGQLGIGNPFAFLGLSLGGKGKRDAATESDEVITKQLFHTPTSLFARLREQLMEKGLVKVLEANSVAFEDVVPGQFVEFEAVLRRSPAVSVLETLIGLAPIMEAVDVPPAPASAGSTSRKTGGRSKKGQAKQRVQPAKGMKEMNIMKLMLDAVTAAGSEDLVAECGVHRFVLTAERPYFVDSTMNDVIDGTFRVFGKVTRVVPEKAEEGISLLRRSALGNFRDAVKELQPAFAGLREAGFKGEVETEIPAPTLQLIPIGIFA